jgi:hypothetical protein
MADLPTLIGTKIEQYHTLITSSFGDFGSHAYQLGVHHIEHSYRHIMHVLSRAPVDCEAAITAEVLWFEVLCGESIPRQCRVDELKTCLQELAHGLFVASCECRDLCTLMEETYLTSIHG